ncbi:toluene-4-monooxygenase system B family protein [Mycobacterium kansasii]
MSTSTITLLTRFAGDLVTRAVEVDKEATLIEVAQAAADVTVGRFVPEPSSDLAFVVRRSEDELGPPLALDITVTGAGLEHRDCVDIEFAEQGVTNA